MKKSKNKHRNKMIDKSIQSEPSTKGHKESPVSSLPSEEKDSPPKEEILTEEQQKLIDELSKDNTNGFDEWSVSWP